MVLQFFSNRKAARIDDNPTPYIYSHLTMMGTQVSHNCALIALFFELF